MNGEFAQCMDDAYVLLNSTSSLDNLAATNSTDGIMHGQRLSACDCHGGGLARSHDILYITVQGLHSLAQGLTSAV
ncbi:uncharacterized protein LAESUDRAFT_730965, partial [Laetiporus sulphureus 93-53]